MIYMSYILQITIWETQSPNTHTNDTPVMCSTSFEILELLHLKHSVSWYICFQWLLSCFWLIIEDTFSNVCMNICTHKYKTTKVSICVGKDMKAPKSQEKCHYSDALSNTNWCHLWCQIKLYNTIERWDQNCQHQLVLQTFY